MGNFLVFTFLSLSLVIACAAIFKLISENMQFQTLHRCGAWKICKSKEDEEEIYYLFYGKEIRSQSSTSRRKFG